jgi:pilus assembly protein Flp/PilA
MKGVSTKIIRRAGIDLVRFIKDESGATAIEYGLIAAMIAVAISATVKSVGANLKTTLASVATSVK